MIATNEEWVQKAEGDYATLLTLREVGDERHWDAICFHAQQCVEKYFKALLIQFDQSFPKTHNLQTLLNLLTPFLPEWQRFHVEALNELTVGAIEYRYPGASIDEEILQEVFELTTVIREAARRILLP